MDTSKKNHQSFALRRVITPFYVGLPLLIIIAALIFLPYMLRTNDWGPLEVLPIGLILGSWIIYSDTRYRIWWRNGEIVQRAVGNVYTKIKINEIDRIAQETSTLHEIASQRRPVRRIAIYTKPSDHMQWIDVSLKHFAKKDIVRLMEEIHKSRPDLQMPDVYFSPK